ncbi:FAD-dependent oxidoreductase [Proteobacteria bacterium 005FR1]|nr:FAD-dependent oxidoreductase [Proteobacteria bacterium 005FR1]
MNHPANRDDHSQIEERVHLDVAVIGGGIAGLWLMNRLQQDGFCCALFEKNQLGSDQTLASQGMIHGGIKYTLAGSLSKASESIADMPAYWTRCLAGEGDVDLRGAKTLSRHFYFWSTDGISSRMSTFFASKAVQGRMDKVPRSDYPDLLKHPDFSGQVYKLQDIVLDTPSVISTLRGKVKEQVFSLADSEYEWRRNKENQAELLVIREGKRLLIQAKQFVFTAGKGNGPLLEALSISKPQMQLRPVHQVWVKHDLPYEFYGHCLGADTTPRISISTHSTTDGKRVWSLGGSVAEAGVKQSPEELIASAKRELCELLPWVDLSNAEWTTRRIDRAEARQRNFLRPDKAFAKSAEGIDNVIVGWPTKLTLTPNLANEVMELLSTLKVPHTTNCPAIDLPQAELSATPWDQEFSHG